MRVSSDQLRADFADLYAPLCLKIEPKSGGALVPFKLKPVQRQLLETIRRQRERGVPPRILILKARQLGFSTATQGMLFHDCHLTPQRRAMVLAHNEVAAMQLFDKSRTFYNNLPPALRPKKKLDNRREVRFAHNDSSLRVQVAKKGGGRSFTTQLVHLSEFAHMENPELVLAAVMDTVPRLLDTLIIIESSPNGHGNVFHDMWVAATNPESRSEWVPLFFPWFCEPEYQEAASFTEDELDEREKELVSKHGVSLRQLAWRRAKIANDYNGDAQTFEQEHPSDDRTCFLHSGRPLFDKGLQWYWESLPDEKERPRPQEFEWAPQQRLGPQILVPKLATRPAGRWRIYRDCQPRMLYALGADCASGIARGDFAPMVVLNRHTLDVDAVFLDRVPADIQAQEAIKGGYYFNEAIVNWDSLNHGIAFGMEIEGKYPNLYYRRVAMDDAGRRMTDRMGFETTTRNRTSMFDLARKFVREHTGRIPDRDVIEQMDHMVYDDRDRPDHQRGGYSDLVVAFIMALIAHKGDADLSTPLLPLSDIQIEQAMERYHRATALGQEPNEEALLIELSLTADELLALDNERHERKMRREALFSEGHL